MDVDLTLETEYKGIITAFQNLKSCTDDLCAAIKQDQELPIWFQPPSILQQLPAYQVDAFSQRDSLIFFLKQLDYLEHQQPKEILLGPGVVACSNTTLTKIEELNAAKAAFKTEIIKVRKPESNNGSRSKKIARLLKKLGLGRIHLKQCYRLCPILPNKPKSISWTWANTRAITQISKSDAYSRLINYQPQDQGIIWQIEKLNNLIKEHEKLAIIQELAPHLRVNILYKDKTRKMIKGSMPVFYHDEGMQLPQINPPKDSSVSSRAKRNDVKIDDEVFLKAIRAHRYIQKITEDA